jgi:hypothetical protein
MRGVSITLLLGLTLLAIGVGLALLRSPLSVARTNGVSTDTHTAIASTDQSNSYCQPRETVPRQTSAIRISLVASIGPRVSVAVLSAGHTISSGDLGPGWTDEVVTVPVKPVLRTVPAATVCVSFHLRDGRLFLLGADTSARFAAREGPRALPGMMRIEYLRPGRRSWASLIPTVVTNIGFSHAVAGAWVVFVLLALVATMVLLASKLVLADRR